MPGDAESTASTTRPGYMLPSTARPHASGRYGAIPRSHELDAPPAWEHDRAGVATGKVRKTLRGRRDKSAHWVTFTRDGNLLASGGGYDWRTRLWDVATGKKRATLKHPPYMEG